MLILIAYTVFLKLVAKKKIEKGETYRKINKQGIKGSQAWLRIDVYFLLQFFFSVTAIVGRSVTRR